ncbi:MAG: helix-turn-helix domain-containing protein [Pseudomonadota bacterium]
MHKGKYIPAQKVADLTPADYVRLACELKKITQAELARKAGVHPSHLSEIVNGKRPIGAMVAKRLAKAMGISVSRLLGEDEIDKMKRKKVENALKKIRRHINESKSLKEDTEQILLKDIQDAIEANRAAS